MTPPSDRPTPHADFDTPEMLAARCALLIARQAAGYSFTAESAERLTDAWVIYDNLLYDAGRTGHDVIGDVGYAIRRWAGGPP